MTVQVDCVTADETIGEVSSSAGSVGSDPTCPVWLDWLQEEEVQFRLFQHDVGFDSHHGPVYQLSSSVGRFLLCMPGGLGAGGATVVLGAFLTWSISPPTLLQKWLEEEELEEPAGVLTFGTLTAELGVRTQDLAFFSS